MTSLTHPDQFFQILLVPICCLCAWLLVGLSSWSVGRTTRRGIRHLQRLHQVPCSRCAFFTGSCYLKCTVQPLNALTEAAINCRDYEPVQSAIVDQSSLAPVQR